MSTGQFALLSVQIAGTDFSRLVHSTTALSSFSETLPQIEYHLYCPEESSGLPTAAMSPHKVPTYAIQDHVHSDPDPIKIIHVGAGASGLLAAYKAERLLQNYELICYEKYFPSIVIAFESRAGC
jgi:hypothetical protein